MYFPMLHKHKWENTKSALLGRVLYTYCGTMWYIYQYSSLALEHSQELEWSSDDLVLSDSKPLPELMLIQITDP